MRSPFGRGGRIVGRLPEWWRNLGKLEMYQLMGRGL
jgi:hypothetical protein